MRWTVVAALMAGVLAAACGSSPRSVPSPSSSPSPRTGWGGPPAPGPNGDVSVASFNAYVSASAPEWRNSPLRAALEFLNVGEPEAFTTSLVLESNPDTRTSAQVTVTKTGLLDDSVAAVRYTLAFERDGDGTWVLRSASWAQRCAPDRGHDGFSPEPCV